MNSPEPVFGGIDAGGTTFKCGVADKTGNLLSRQRVPVSTPEQTLAGCADFFRKVMGDKRLASLGIASFGPLGVDPDASSYGSILKTPKPGWSHTDLIGYFSSALQTEIKIDTDVNGALLAEMESGAAAQARSAAYVTIGTGIGAGMFLNGGLVGKPVHPEFGHIPLRRHPEDAAFKGVCPFHSDCLEGLASVTAIRARWGDPVEFPANHHGWPIIADYLAQACRSLSLTLRLEKIILGGGLMLAPHLLERVRDAYDTQMADYLVDRALTGADIIHRPGLGDDAGLHGAIWLARSIPAPRR